jgi:hypothetical protein
MHDESRSFSLRHSQSIHHKSPEREYFTKLSDEQVVFIINRNIGLAPYTHEFVQTKTDAQDLSGFICALSSFMDEVSGTPSNNWKTVYREDSTLLVEGGV